MPLLLAAEPAAEHAVEHAEVIALNWLPAATSLVVFLVAFGFLYVKVWPKIIKALDDRERKIREDIESAEAAREQAKAALAEYEKELAGAREEASQIIAKAKIDAKAVAEQLRTRNETDLAKMRDRATRELESAKRTAIAELHGEAANLAADIAGKILQRQITPQDQQRLIDESLRELTSVRGD
jgi:F-type H+-transporting ATPase subunit b